MPYTKAQYRDEYEPIYKDWRNFRIKKALSRESAEKSGKPYGWGFNNESYMQDGQMVIDGPFLSKKEAERSLASLQDEYYCAEEELKALRLAIEGAESRVDLSCLCNARGFDYLFARSDMLWKSTTYGLEGRERMHELEIKLGVV